MRISLSWLKELLPINDSAEFIADRLTGLGLEVEGMEQLDAVKGGLQGIVVGRILECIKHPQADRLSLTKVDVGAEESLSIVCGAPNVAAGQLVLVATVGTTLYPSAGEPFKISKAKVRGEVSEGMICAEDEMGLGQSHDGILVLHDQALLPGTPAAEALGLKSDVILEIGLTPNRSDATNHMGVAKDLLAWYRVHSDPKMQINLPPLDALAVETGPLDFEVVVEDTNRCPRYSGICLDNVTIAPSPAWLEEKIKAMGQNPVNNLVDITNLVMFEMGQPLHAFDYDRIEGHSLHIGTLAEGTSFTTLDQQERKLRSSDLMICDRHHKPLCIAGVLGELESGIKDNTKRVFLESAHFQASSIRLSSMGHNIRTQAAKCFEKGSDPNATITALQRAVYLLKLCCNAKVAAPVIDIYPEKVKPAEIHLETEEVKKWSGIQLDTEKLKSILFAMDMEIIDERNGALVIHVPTNKADVTRPADVIEEVCRVYGLDKIPVPDKIQLSFPQQIASTYHLKKQLSDKLSSWGLNEIISLSLSSSDLCKKTAVWTEEQLIYVHNTSNVHLDVMKPGMVLGGLEAIQFNQNRQQTDLKLFEFGKDYTRDKEQIQETAKLGIWTCGSVEPSIWSLPKPAQQDFFSIKSLVDSILTGCGINPELSILENGDAQFAYCAEWKQHQSILAKAGYLKQNLTSSFDIKKPVFYAEIYLKGLSKKQNAPGVKYQEVSKFPSVRRDLAVVVDRSVSFAQLKTIAQKNSGKLLKGVGLFDIYENENQLGADKKSMAIQLHFESTEKSLNSEEIDKLINRLISQYEQQLSAVIRR